MRIQPDPFDDDMGAGPEPLGHILARSAAELADLADRTERLQDVMADLVRQFASLDHESTRDMQALDWIAQHLEGLSSFLSALSEQSLPGWRIDPTGALDALTLAELAHRLRGGPAAPVPAAVMSSGDLDLF
ncbi:MAG TPA: hypothetical protein VHY32_03555 [Caulobacteraceae bacterium]|nr:hypothetical protein [Caulobacteraceae bacterium]